MDEVEALATGGDSDIEDQVLRITRTYQPYGLAIVGEIDAARHSVFLEALATLDADGKEVHLDLARLDFIDLGGLALIADHAVRNARRYTIVLDHVPAQLRMVMEIVGWQVSPGLQLGEPSEVEVA